VAAIDDPDLVAREYASLDRLANRRLDRTGWLRGVEEIATVLGAVAEARPQRVLDAGCGTGEWAALLTAPEVVCVDQSEAAVEAARARGFEALRADIQALPFEDGSFDVVMCNWVLYHLADLDLGLSEIARVLRPGGRFVGAYNREGHLEELWSRVEIPWPADAFDGRNGAEALARHLVSVERRDTSGEVLWESRAALQAYLDAYREMLGELSAPAGPYPFRATRRNCVFVAMRPR
jgi:SAM-dependent methyltransferase